ncbi:helix-turn-helix domain-containing protein [Alphaproteobacteria bacterium LSUCC0226]
MQDIYLTPKQAAEFLGVSIHTLQNQRVQRVGPPFIKIRNRLIRYKLADLIAYLEKNRVVTVG